MKNEPRSRVDVERLKEVALVTISLIDNECQRECSRENNRDYTFKRM